MIFELIKIVLFPGLMFLSLFGVVAEFIDRKLYAKFQNRVGPPWFQPVADFIKLLGKEDIIPEDAEPVMFKTLPVVAITAAVTASLYIPIWSNKALFSFEGDVIVVVYLLTIPTLTFFLGGWNSNSLYSMIGSVRTLTQLFAFEVPLFMGILAPALLANTWSLSGISAYYGTHPWLVLVNLLAFGVAIVAVQGKLEKVPFDIPEAETEIVAGAFTEYSGRLLALFRMAIDIEMVVASSLLAAVFLPFGLQFGPVVGFLLYIIKVLLLVCVMALLRTVFARLRLDQMVRFCWRYLAPAALLQICIVIIVKGIVLQ